MALFLRLFGLFSRLFRDFGSGGQEESFEPFSGISGPEIPETPVNVRKILVSVKSLSAILGPEMGAPILWTPGKNAFFLQEKPMSIKFLVLGRGGVFWVLGGGESADFIFMGARIFLKMAVRVLTIPKQDILMPTKGHPN